MIRPVLKISEVQQGIAGAEIQIALGSPGQPVIRDVQVDRRPPNEPAWLKTLALDATAFDDVQRGIGDDVQIVAADLDVSDPGVGRKAVQQLTRLVATAGQSARKRTGLRARRQTAGPSYRAATTETTRRARYRSIAASNRPARPTASAAARRRRTWLRRPRRSWWPKHLRPRSAFDAIEPPQSDGRRVGFQRVWLRGLDRAHEVRDAHFVDQAVAADVVLRIAAEVQRPGSGPPRRLRDDGSLLHQLAVDVQADLRIVERRRPGDATGRRRR